jgi:two-component system response regulator FixJ
MRTEPTICVIDDEAAVRDSIRMMLQRRGYVVCDFESAESYLGAEDPDRFGCIVCDVRLKGLSGLDLQEKLAERGCDLPLILITGHGDIDLAVAAIKRGAFDFIEKPFADTRLYDSVAGALSARGQALEKQAETAAMAARVAELTERQRQVMELLVDGLSNKAIAKRLAISPRTVETYRALVMAKTGVASLAELVRIAIRLGIRS